MTANSIPTKLMVRVSCETFNHAPYIEDAMNGFCMQQTTFPFVCTIVDDASTDGEQEVIRKYLQEHFDLEDNSVVRNEETDDYVLTFARHKTNSNCFFAVFYLKYNHYSIKKSKNPYLEEWHDVKYIALCEGDDYWTDPLKLQKQVNFLEANPDYGMVYSKFRSYYQDKQEYSESVWGVQSDFEDMLLQNKVGTMTTMIRTALWDDYQKEIQPVALKRQWKMGDKPLWLYIMSKTKAYCFPEITSIYRVLEQSMSHFITFIPKCKFTESSFDICFYFAERNNVSKDLIKKIAEKEVDTLISDAYLYDGNLNFPFYQHMKKYDIFTWKKYMSAKLRSTRAGRDIYRILKKNFAFI